MAMSEQPVTLEFLGRKLAQVLDEMGEFRDQLTILTAICMRVEGAVGALTIEVRAMHSRHARLERRVTKLEGGDDAAAAE
jgi:hypothetical protein